MNEAVTFECNAIYCDYYSMRCTTVCLEMIPFAEEIIMRNVIFKQPQIAVVDAKLNSPLLLYYILVFIV